MTQPFPVDRDYTLAEAAEAIRMSERWIRNLVNAEDSTIEYVRRGHKILFTADQLEKLRLAHVKAPIEQSITTGRKKRAS